MLVEIDGVNLNKKTKTFRMSPSYHKEKHLFELFIDVDVNANYWEKETRVDYIFEILIYNKNTKFLPQPEFLKLGDIKVSKKYDHDNFDEFYKEAWDLAKELKESLADFEKGLETCNTVIQNNTLKP